MSKGKITKDERAGMTLFSIAMLIWTLICVTGVAAIIWVAIHFLRKYW